MAESSLPPSKRAKTGEPSKGLPVVEIDPIRSGCIRATISDGDGEGDVGSIEARLVQRNRNFLSKCDEISSDLQAVACAMFEPDGAPRCRELTFDMAGKRGKKGAFLYLETEKLEEGYREHGNSDFGSKAIKKFLNHPKIADKWTVVVYIGDYRATLTDEECKKDDNDSLGRFHAERNGTLDPEVEFERRCNIQEGIASDVRQFVRCGFRELSEETVDKVGWMFINKDIWNEWQQRTTAMSHADAVAVTLRADEKLDRNSILHSAKDEELMRFIVSRGEELSMGGMLTGRISSFSSALGTPPATTIASIMTGADRLVADGADYNRANVLHACASNGITSLLDPLVRRGALVNGKDKNGMTPLMIAAAAAPMQARMSDPGPSAGGLRALLTLGADKDITDKVGRTALGHFYTGTKNVSDFQTCFGMGANTRGPDPAIERLLMPTSGATTVDKRAK